MHPIRPLVVTALALPATLLLSGCTLQQTTSAPSAKVLVQKVTGTLHGGQQPVTGSTVTVYAVGTTGYGSSATALSSTTSGAYGAFTMPAYTCPQANTPVYIVASGGNPGLANGTNNSALTLAAALGQCGTAQNLTVNIDEVTTVAAAYSMAQFAAPNTTGSFGGPSTTSGGNTVYSVGLTNAVLYTAPTLVNSATGLVNANSATTTIESDQIYSIANTLASCVNSDGTGTACATLFAGTTPPSGTAPANTLAAAVNMALYPYQNVSTLFNLASAQSPYIGATSAPADFTIAVAYTAPPGATQTSSGVTMSNLAIDASGNIWLPTGKTGVLSFNPSQAAFAGPFATQASTGQVAIDMSGYLWATDGTTSYLSKLQIANPSSVSNLQMSSPVTGTLFYGSAIAIGTANQLFVGGGNSNNNTNFVSSVINGTATYQIATLSHVVYSGNMSDTADAGYATTDQSSTAYGEFVTTSNNAARVSINLPGVLPGQIFQVKNRDTLIPVQSTNQLCNYGNTCTAAGFAGMSTPIGGAADGNATIWVANKGNGSVSNLSESGLQGTLSAISPTGYLKGPTYMPGASGLAIDQSGNIWVSNPFVSTYVLTEIIGSAGPTIQPLAAQYQSSTGFRTGTRPTN